MKQKDEIKLKPFNMRMPHEIWNFLKIEAAKEQVSMTHIIVKSVEAHRKRLEAERVLKNETKKVFIEQKELNSIMSALKNAQNLIDNMSA